MTAVIRVGEEGLKRVKTWGPGPLIGELSAYTPERRRTATLIADTEAVLYHLSSESLARFDAEDLRLAASIHERSPEDVSSSFIQSGFESKAYTSIRPFYFRIACLICPAVVEQIPNTRTFSLTVSR